MEVFAPILKLTDILMSVLMISKTSVRLKLMHWLKWIHCLYHQMIWLVPPETSHLIRQEIVTQSRCRILTTLSIRLP